MFIRLVKEKEKVILYAIFDIDTFYFS